MRNIGIIKRCSFGLLSVLLSACGGEGGSKSTNSSDHPQFKWSDANVSSNYSPLGDTTNQSPKFIWPTYTDAGQLATEYNFGFENTNATQWQEFTVPAVGAACTTGGTCSYTPSQVFNIGDEKVWWVRGKINGSWMEWSSPHVFKIVDTTTPPPTTTRSPSGDTATTNPTFTWSPLGSTNRYEFGFEPQGGGVWRSYTVNANQLNCQTGTCSNTPNHTFSIGDKMTWWFRPVAGRWSNGVDFTIVNSGGNDTQAPTAPTALSSTGVTSTTVALKWNASTDNVGVTAYQVYRNGQSIATTANTTYTDSALQASTQYSYVVRALDAAGNVSGNSNELQVTTENTGGPIGDTINKRIATGSDDAEEFANGSMYLDSSDLELTYSSSSQKVGLRFNALAIPPNATITNAYIQFKVDETSSGSVPLTIFGEASNSASTFTNTAQNISSRSKTTASITWNPAAWNVVGQAGSNQRTPNLTSVIQEIVSRAGWGSGNAMAFIISSNSTAKRVAESYEGDSLGAPLLHIEFTTGGGGGGDTQAPTAPTLSVNKVKAESVSMKWTASTDNIGVTGYNVYRDGQLLTTVNKLKYKDITVQPNTTYTYTIKALDAAGNVSQTSNGLTVTTLLLGSTDIDEPAGIYNTGLDVLQLTVKVLPPVGNTCETNNYAGCSFGSVLQDLNRLDDFKPEVKVEFTSINGFSALGTMRQRGGNTRNYPVKSFRVKLDKSEPAWNGEHRLQFIKAYADPTRMRHKVNYDLISEVDKLPSMRTRYVHLFVEDKGEFTFEKLPVYNILADYKTTDMGIYLQVEYFGKEYLERRNWIADSRVYKVESFQFKWEPAAFALDVAGKPTNLVEFEKRVEIKNGKDHRAFVEMLQAVNNASNNFDDVFATYFDRENYINWMSVNLLSSNWDTRTHNYYLYNPKGTKKFYFIPWDYDNSYKDNKNPATGISVTPPYWNTHALYWPYVLHRRFISGAGNVTALQQKMQALHQTTYSIANLSDKLDSYRPIVQPFILRSPDNIWKYRRLPTDADRIALFNGYVDTIVDNATINYDNFVQYLDSPMPFRINSSSQQAGLFRATWSSSVSLSGNPITYDLVISSSNTFAAGDIVTTVTGLTSTSYSNQKNLAAGTYYVKVISRDTTNPQNLWQLPTNQIKVVTPGQVTYRVFGVREMIIQ